MNAPQPESMNEDDFSKPWPQYTRLFEESPELAASKALELFSRDDLEYLPFILSFPWEEDASRLPKELHSSHFPIALLDIVTNRRWYAQLRTQKVAGPQGAGREEYWVALKIYHTLRCISKIIILDSGKVQRPTEPSTCEGCIDRFSLLWKMLWDRDNALQHYMFAENFAGSNGDIFPLIAYLLECHFVMVRQLQQGAAPSLSSHAAHIALLLWGRSSPQTYQSRVSARIIVAICEERVDPRKHHIAKFLNEATLPATGLPLETLFKALPSEDAKDMLEPSRLYDVLNIVLAVLYGSLSMARINDDYIKEALYRLARMSRRYQCHGDMSGGPLADRRISIMTLSCFQFIYKINKEAVMKCVTFGPQEFNFLTEVASVIDILRESIVAIITALKIFGGGRWVNTQEEAARAFADIRRILHGHWLPILEDLSSALHAFRRGRDQTSVTHLEEITKLWHDLGTMYRLNRYLRERDLLVRYLTPAERVQGCFLMECPCYGRKSRWHKTRRVCRGRCQMRDWKLGHRDMCLGRQSLS
ncbi:hypothetical protein BC629DRAFT_1554683 [Irpex lacteus]|nr:hypothetical protein BC629DRAFT_1554683 [Irpex lacteus]